MRRIVPLIMACVGLVTSFGYAQTYRWVDEQGAIHFTDDLSNIPERYREKAESRRELPKETLTPKPRDPTPSVLPLQEVEPEGITVELLRSGEVSYTEVVLNGNLKQYLVVDTGASFTVISRGAARELGITIDEQTPLVPIATASSVIFNPLVTLRSVRVGKAEVEDVDAVVHNLPSGSKGLLGNSFLSEFKVMLDSFSGKMTLIPWQGTPSPDRPGGYGREFWISKFRHYNRVLAQLNKMKRNYEQKGGVSTELVRVNNAIRHFESRLSDLERKASQAGVPRNWRE